MKIAKFNGEVLVFYSVELNKVQHPAWYIRSHFRDKVSNVWVRTTGHLVFHHNFGKREPIYKILTCEDYQENVSCDPALCRSRPIVAPYYCRLGDLLCFVFMSAYCMFDLSVYYLFLQYFDTVGWVFWPVKIVSHKTYTVLEGTTHCSIQSNRIMYNYIIYMYMYYMYSKDSHLICNALLDYLMKSEDSKNARDLDSIHNKLLLCSNFYDILLPVIC